MNRIPRKRLVTLMAAAAGVTAGFGSMAEPAQARTPALATVAADTVPAKSAAAAKKSGAAAPAKAATTKKPEVAPSTVVSAAPSNSPSVNDVCGSEEDCRNINGGGH